MGGGRAEPQPEPSAQAFHRDAPTAWWSGGGRQVTVLGRRAKLLSLNTLSQRAAFYFHSEQTLMVCVKHSVLKGGCDSGWGPHGRMRPPQGLRGDGWPRLALGPRGEQLLGVREKARGWGPGRKGGSTRCNHAWRRGRVR